MEVDPPLAAAVSDALYEGVPPPPIITTSYVVVLGHVQFSLTVIF